MLTISSLWAAALLAGIAQADVPKALYFMSNLPSGNSIHAVPVNATGFVSGQGSITATGGVGSRAPAEMLTDALNSQGSIAINGEHLYVVNAGSNTVSVLRIDNKDPTAVKLVGSPVSSYGDFPNSIAVQPKLKLACVSNSGTRSGVACYHITKNGSLIPDKAGLRPLVLTPKQSNPPTGPFNTVSQVLFSANADTLYTLVKGAPNSTAAGYFASFPVNNGSVSTTQVDSHPNGTLVLFGSVALPNNRVFYTDASFGAGLLQVNSKGQASTVTHVPIPGNAATCWAAYSKATDLLYTTDDGANQVASFNATTGEMVKLNKLRNGVPQMIEILSAGPKLYALSHGTANITQHIIVMTPKENGKVYSHQTFALDGVNDDVEGLVAYMG